MAVTPEEILGIEKDIIYTLKNIYDPEIPVNIYDLGLVYEIDVEPDGTANIRMTLTALNLTLTFEPAWSRDMMSEEALLELGLL